MKFNEFRGIDVVTDMEQRIQESVNESRPKLTESIIDDQKEVDVFVTTAEGQSVLEPALVVGQFYWPVLFVSTLPKKLLQTSVTTTAAEFLGVVGGRLEFRFANSSKSMFFPYDIGMVALNNWHRFVYEEKDHLDSFAITMMMKFANRDWILNTAAYTNQGEYNTVSNLSFVPTLNN